MALYVSSACLAGYTDVVEFVHQLSRIGLRSIELGSGSPAGPELAQRLAACDCRYLVHNYFPPPPEPFVLNLASADPVVQKRSIELAQQAIRLSAKLGSPFYSVHAGFITDPTGFGGTSFIFPDPPNPEAAQQAFDRFAANLQIVADYARQHQIGLLVENNVCPPDLRGKLLFQTAAEVLALLEAVPVGLLLDTGHLNVTAHTFGFDRLAFVEKTLPYIRALHIHDNDGSRDAHKPPAANSWVFEILRLPALADTPMVIEAKFQTAADLRHYVDWLTEMI